MAGKYDIADPNDPNTLRVPFMFVPHGCEPTPEWLQAHPGWVRIPAVMVPRDPQPGEGRPQWSVQLAGAGGSAWASAAAPAAPAIQPGTFFAPVGLAANWPVDQKGGPWLRSRFGQPTCPIHELPSGMRKPGEAPGPGRSYDVMGDALGAWQAAAGVFADPGRFAGTGASDPGSRGVQYADAGRNVGTDATQTESPPPTVDIFIGGFLDEEFKNVKDYAEDYEKRYHKEIKYFPNDAKSDIKNYIASLPAGTRINLIGHSWGADTAANIAADSAGKINTLITVDPVSWGKPNFQTVRSHTNVWIDVRATPTEHGDVSNIVAGLGGDWGNLPKDAATTYIEAAENHAEFAKMMRTKGPDGRTAEQILLSQ